MGKPILSSTKGAQDGNLHCYHLPKGIVHFFIKRISGSAGKFYVIETPTVELVPDWNHRYFFQYTPSSFTDDDLTLEFSDQGFLRRVHTLIDDQTDEFIEKIGELATTAIEAAVTLPGAFKTRGMTGATEELVYEARLDPFREEEVKAMNLDLSSFIDPNLSFSASVPDPVNYQPDPNRTANQQAIYSRPPVLAEINLHNGAMVDRKTIRLPHPYLTHVVEIPRAPFVKTEFLIEFNDMAYPTLINIKKPSTAMAIIQVPINILNALIALPAKLFSFKFNFDNSGHNQGPRFDDFGPNMRNAAPAQLYQSVTGGGGGSNGQDHAPGAGNGGGDSGAAPAPAPTGGQSFQTPTASPVRELPDASALMPIPGSGEMKMRSGSELDQIREIQNRKK